MRRKLSLLSIVSLILLMLMGGSEGAGCQGGSAGGRQVNGH